MATWITADRLIDGTGQPPISPGALLVENGRIAWVGGAGELHPPAGCEQIDLPGQTLLPGFIDAHVHLSLPPQLREPDHVRAVWITRNLRAYLKSGCTTLRVVGEFNGLDLYFRRCVAEDVVPGPRLMVAGDPLNSSNGHGLGTIVDGADAVRRAVRANLHAGVDLIKIFVTGGLTTVDTALGYTSFTEAEVATAVEEAHRAGRRVAAHAISHPGVSISLAAGVDTIEHGTFLSDHDVELFKKSGALLVCTYGCVFHPEGMERRFSFPGVRELVLAAREAARDGFQKVALAGVPYAVGTDNMIGRFSYEIECLVRLGASPMDALVAATRGGANALGIADRVGTLESGKLADIISVRGNPLSDLLSLNNVGLIMKEGRRYDWLSEV